MTDQRVSGESDNFDEAVIGGSVTAPGPGASAITGDVEEEDGVTLFRTQLGRDVLAVALDSHVVGQILPSP